MTIEVVKRGLKVFIRAHNSKMRYSSEVELHLKQACSYLMYFGNDFDRFIRDALIFHSGGKISLIDMNKLRYLAAVQNSYQQQSTDSLTGYEGEGKNIQEEDYEEEGDQFSPNAGIATFGKGAIPSQGKGKLKSPANLNIFEEATEIPQDHFITGGDYLNGGSSVTKKKEGAGEDPKMSQKSIATQQQSKKPQVFSLEADDSTNDQK